MSSPALGFGSGGSVKTTTLNDPMFDHNNQPLRIRGPHGQVPWGLQSGARPLSVGSPASSGGTGAGGRFPATAQWGSYRSRLRRGPIPTAGPSTAPCSYSVLDRVGIGGLGLGWAASTLTLQSAAYTLAIRIFMPPPRTTPTYTQS